MKRRRRVNYYYDLTWDPEIGAGLWTNDNEGCLVALCSKHAAMLEADGEVEFASEGDEDYCQCEYPGCRAHN